MFNPKSTDRHSFPWWYNWVKWVLPIALALSASAWVGLTLTASIPAYGMLKWAPVLFSSLEGFSALAALTFAMGAIASMVGIATTIFTRAGLSNVSENVARINMERNFALQEKYAEVVKQLEEVRKAAKHDHEEADIALEAAGQRNEALVNQFAEAAKQPSPAANDEEVPAAKPAARKKRSS